MEYDARLLNLTAFKTISRATAAFPLPRRSKSFHAASVDDRISYPAETGPVPGMYAGPCAPSIAPALDSENEIVELPTSGSASIATETLIVRADGARRDLSVAAIRSAHQGASRSTLLNVGMATALTETENGARRDSLFYKEQRTQGTIAMECGPGLFTEGGSDFTESEVAIEANFSIDAYRTGPSHAFADEGGESKHLADRAFRTSLCACGHSRPSMN